MNDTYVVIGGTSGIGLEITKRLSSENNNVFVYSRNSSDVAALPGVKFSPIDVLKDEINSDIFPDRIDGLVYCPGSINLKPFRGLKESDFQADFEINVLGAIKVIKATQKALKKSNQASVVLFSTVAVQQGMPFHASVAAAKGAVEGLSRSLAAEFAPSIRVNCIAPSLTDTPLAERLLSSDSKRESAAERHPVRRFGTPDDIATAAVYLLKKESSWVTGQVMGVDGGMSTLRV